jgi:hypothetical protein
VFGNAPLDGRWDQEADGQMPIDTGLVGAESAFPDLDRWNPWRPKQLTSRLQALEVPWAVAAGWAIDLFAGRESRAHDDLEIVVARASFGAVRAALPEHLVRRRSFGGRTWSCLACR